MKSNEILKVENLTKEYINDSGYKIRLFEDLSFSILENEFTSIIAPEGSGKSSLLKILSKLDENYSGNIVFNSERKIVYIPDIPTSFQWLDVYENIKLVGKNKSNDEIQQVIDDVGLTGYEKQSPHPSAVGFRLRISVARALIVNPKIILLDNVFDLIKDYKTRIELLQLLRRLNEKYQETTFVIATNNINIGIFLGTKILLLNKFPGKLVDSIINEEGKRDESFFESEKFNEIKNRIEKIFKAELNQTALNLTV